MYGYDAWGIVLMSIALVMYIARDDCSNRGLARPDTA